jgi:hypothetical protein
MTAAELRLVINRTLAPKARVLLGFLRGAAVTAWAARDEAAVALAAILAWALLTQVAAAVIPRPDLVWRASIGLFLLALIGWRFVWTVASHGLYNLTREKKPEARRRAS